MCVVNFHALLQVTTLCVQCRRVKCLMKYYFGESYMKVLLLHRCSSAISFCGELYGSLHSTHANSSLITVCYASVSLSENSTRLLPCVSHGQRPEARDWDHTSQEQGKRLCSFNSSLHHYQSVEFCLSTSMYSCDFS